MAVRIRLRRQGCRNNPAYRIVVADSRSPRDGRFIEVIGHYIPVRQPAELKVNVERAEYWLSQGAQPSDTVRALLRQAGVGVRGSETTEPESAAQEEPPSAEA